MSLPVLKDEQRIAVDSVKEGKDVFVVLPTGYGKSMCYVAPPVEKTKVSY